MEAPYWGRFTRFHYNTKQSYIGHYTFMLILTVKTKIYPREYNGPLMALYIETMGWAQSLQLGIRAQNPGPVGVGKHQR